MATMCIRKQQPPQSLLHLPAARVAVKRASPSTKVKLRFVHAVALLLLLLAGGLLGETNSPLAAAALTLHPINSYIPLLLLHPQQQQWQKQEEEQQHQQQRRVGAHNVQHVIVPLLLAFPARHPQGGVKISFRNAKSKHFNATVVAAARATRAVEGVRRNSCSCTPNRYSVSIPGTAAAAGATTRRTSQVCASQRCLGAIFLKSPPYAVPAVPGHSARVVRPAAGAAALAEIYICKPSGCCRGLHHMLSLCSCDGYSRSNNAVNSRSSGSLSGAARAQRKGYLTRITTRPATATVAATAAAAVLPQSWFDTSNSRIARSGSSNDSTREAAVGGAREKREVKGGQGNTNSSVTPGAAETTKGKRNESEQVTEHNSKHPNSNRRPWWKARWWLLPWKIRFSQRSLEEKLLHVPVFVVVNRFGAPYLAPPLLQQQLQHQLQHVYEELRRQLHSENNSAEGRQHTEGMQQTKKQQPTTRNAPQTQVALAFLDPHDAKEYMYELIQSAAGAGGEQLEAGLMCMSLSAIWQQQQQVLLQSLPLLQQVRQGGGSQAAGTATTETAATAEEEEDDESDDETRGPPPVQWRLVAGSQEARHARQLKAWAPQMQGISGSGCGGVPLFYSEELLFERDGEAVLPLFFSLKDMEEAWACKQQQEANGILGVATAANAATSAAVTAAAGSAKKQQHPCTVRAASLVCDSSRATHTARVRENSALTAPSMAANVVSAVAQTPPATSLKQLQTAAAVGEKVREEKPAMQKCESDNAATDTERSTDCHQGMAAVRIVGVVPTWRAQALDYSVKEKKAAEMDSRTTREGAAVVDSATTQATVASIVYGERKERGKKWWTSLWWPRWLWKLKDQKKHWKECLPSSVKVMDLTQLLLTRALQPQHPFVEANLFGFVASSAAVAFVQEEKHKGKSAARLMYSPDELAEDGGEAAYFD